MKNNANRLLFTINLGIFCERLSGIELPRPRQIRVYDGHLEQRIGGLLPGNPDLWWEIEHSTNVLNLALEVSSLLSRLAIPYLEQFDSVDALTVLWKSGRSPGRTNYQRERYLNALGL